MGSSGQGQGALSCGRSPEIAEWETASPRAASVLPWGWVGAHLALCLSQSRGPLPPPRGSHSFPVQPPGLPAAQQEPLHPVALLVLPGVDPPYPLSARRGFASPPAHPPKTSPHRQLGATASWGPDLGPALVLAPGVSCPCPQGRWPADPEQPRAAAGRRVPSSRPVLCSAAAAARWCPQCEDADAGSCCPEALPPLRPVCLASPVYTLAPLVSPGWCFSPTGPAPCLLVGAPRLCDPPGSMVLPHLCTPCLHAPPVCPARRELPPGGAGEASSPLLPACRVHDALSLFKGSARAGSKV